METGLSIYIDLKIKVDVGLSTAIYMGVNANLRLPVCPYGISISIPRLRTDAEKL